MTATSRGKALALPLPSKQYLERHSSIVPGQFWHEVTGVRIVMHGGDNRTGPERPSLASGMSKSGLCGPISNSDPGSWRSGGKDRSRLTALALFLG